MHVSGREAMGGLAKSAAGRRQAFRLQGFKGSGAGMAGPGLGVRTLESGRVRSARLARSSTSEGTTARDVPDLEVESPRGDGAGPMSGERARIRCGRTVRECRGKAEPGVAMTDHGPGDLTASPPSAAVTERRGARVPARVAVARGAVRSDWARRRARLYSRNSSTRFLGSFSRRYSK